MSTALIGYTGFVGSTLMRAHPFDATYNSSNIDEMRGRSFDTVVCAGVRAEKWLANANPEADRAGIDRLTGVLETVTAGRMVLVSTVDVFGVPRGVDERSPVVTEGLHPYGLHRRGLESWVSRRFRTTVVRLPGLYGAGIKKNVIHDYLAGHELEKIDTRGSFQFYGLDRLWRDIGVAMASDLELVHLVTEPVKVRDVLAEAFGLDVTNELANPPASYDVGTIRAPLFGGQGRYIEDRATVLAGIARFVGSARRARGGA